ncbi:hypothetical protein BDN72DRAFT_840067 [Pluteus cervinus]|uniref:Uncharacterized protein n=1 Tax=Pluteus cervinus TaxID=181527 RepID=A0ACD3AWH7_9AGAR|nr:hypothetical protein BDN72DRAFT_840067 [Pluteus cervinus]
MEYNTSSIYTTVTQGSALEPSSSRRPRAYSEADAYGIPAEYMQDLVAPQWPGDSSNQSFNLPFQDKLYPGQENFTYTTSSAAAFVPAETHATYYQPQYMMESSLAGSPALGALPHYNPGHSPELSDSGNEALDMDPHLGFTEDHLAKRGEEQVYRHVIGSEEGRRVSEARRKREARHLCTLCGRGLTSRDNLTNHLNFHFNIKPYECPHCKKAFTTKADCTRHTKKCGH